VLAREWSPARDVPVRTALPSEHRHRPRRVVAGDTDDAHDILVGTLVYATTPPGFASWGTTPRPRVVPVRIAGRIPVRHSGGVAEETRADPTTTTTRRHEPTPSTGSPRPRRVGSEVVPEPVVDWWQTPPSTTIRLADAVIVVAMVTNGSRRNIVGTEDCTGRGDPQRCRVGVRSVGPQPGGPFDGAECGHGPWRAEESSRGFAVTT
jgi:hypothetical protein